MLFPIRTVAPLLAHDAGYRPEEYAYDKAREIKKLSQSIYGDLCQADRNKNPISPRLGVFLKIESSRRITKSNTQIEGYLLSVLGSRNIGGPNSM